MGVVDPLSVARAAGLELIGKPEGLTLTDGTMELRADFGRMLPRLKPSAARAVGKGRAHKRHREPMGD